MTPPIDKAQALVDILTAHTDQVRIAEKLARMMQIENHRLRWLLAECQWRATQPFPWETP
jgi:hypothetical protein